jgi:hypothetical protein
VTRCEKAVDIKKFADEVGADHLSSVTLIVAREDIEKFIAHTGHTARVLELPTR